MDEDILLEAVVAVASNGDIIIQGHGLIEASGIERLEVEYTWVTIFRTKEPPVAMLMQNEKSAALMATRCAVGSGKVLEFVKGWQ